MTPSPPGLPSGLAAYDPARGYPSVVPCVLYDDVPAAVRWLSDAFGFREIVSAAMPDGWPGHSEMERGGFVVLLARRGGPLGDGASVIQVFVEEVSATCATATRLGGTVLDPPAERPWGVRQAVVRDPQGQRWVPTQYLRETDPVTWYGRLLGPATPLI